MTNRNGDGTFSRKNKLWTPDNWDEGYTDNKGRFRVYRPDCPRAYSEGYALRAHVVYWLHHGVAHPVGTELHHKDLTKNNDRIENLVVLTKSEHRKTHRENWVLLTCECCGVEFREHFWRTQSRKVRFCSQECYQLHPRSKEHRDSISVGLKLAYKNGAR